ncbi:MAG: Smr/MutS family protein [Treponema sp.]|jgi:DNA-nicking Smr family endonuclease|nr:Smr/MutS family protein [Treponema sp.]
MNFGEILNKWERTQSGASGKSDMETYLKKNDIYDKDSAANKPSAPGEKRRRLLSSRPDDILDIHGLTIEAAWSSLNDFFTKAKNTDCKKLRIIHGKGNHSDGKSILRDLVLKFTEQCPFAGETGPEKSANGGTGATWVLLKQ